MHRAVLAIIALVGLVAAPSAGASPPVGRAAATCSDYSNQADAQRAADTRDADGDGIYCETLPCPCLRPGSGGGGGGGTHNSAQQRARERAKKRGAARRRAARRRAARRRAARRRAAARRKRRLIERRRTALESCQGARIVDVVDGDTVKLDCSTVGTRTVRLIGIDTPESVNPNAPVECGAREATSAMLGLTYSTPADTNGDQQYDAEGGTAVVVKITTDRSQDFTDRFGRVLAYLNVVGDPPPAIGATGYDLGESMITGGYSAAYIFRDDFARLATYQAREHEAQAANRGLWAQCAGNFHRPA